MLGQHDIQRQRITRAWSAVHAETPIAWHPRLHRHVLDAVEQSATSGAPWEKQGDTIRTLEAWRERFGGLLHADVSHSEIVQLAEQIADDARALHIGDPLGVALLPGQLVPIPPADLDPWPAWRQVVAFIERHHGQVPALPSSGDVGQHLAATARRARCARWWRRQLRRYVARTAEAAAITLGLVHKRAGQVYVSDKAMQRRAAQRAATEAALKARTIENAAGQSFSLWDVMQRGTGNKAIRRGELMTRVRGAEEMADECGLVGTFWTLTAPAEFHPRDHHTGRVNPAFNGATPREAHAWLRDSWVKARTDMKDRGIRVMGLRVVEPHHDGCPHWHALLWCEPGQVGAMRDTITAAWFRELPDDAAKRRARKKWGVKCVEIDERGAVGYVSKYVAKNIDAPLPDGGVIADHADAAPADMAQQRDMLDGAEITTAARVEAWATTWGIRQFQFLGLPSVTVWRELRRIHENAIAGKGDPEVTRAWWAAHRHGCEGVEWRDYCAKLAEGGRSPEWIEAHRPKLQRADWAEYCRAQGGVMLKRTEYRVRLWTHETRQAGGYMPGQVVRRPLGVTSDRMAGRMARSTRQAWGSEGFGRACADAWTRLHNCGPAGPAYADPRPKVYGRANWEPRKPIDSRAARDPRSITDLARELQARNRPPDQASLPAFDALAHAEAVPRMAAPAPISSLLADLQARNRAARAF